MAGGNKEVKLNLRLTAQDDASKVFQTFANDLKKSFSQINTELKNSLNIKGALSGDDQAVKTLGTNLKNLGLDGAQGATKAASELTKVTKGASEATKQVQSLGNWLKEQQGWNKIGSVGQSLANFGRQSGGFLVSAIKSAAEFDQSLHNTQASFHALNDTQGLTQQAFDAMQKQALAFGRQGFFSATEVAGSMNDLARQGISYNDIMQGVGKTVYQVAAANQTNIGETGTVVADIAHEMGDALKKTYGDIGKGMDVVGNVMTTTLHTSRISMQDYLDTMKYAGPQASALGVDIKDLSTAIAIMGEHGIKGTQAGTALRRMMTNLTPSTKAQTAEFKQLGFITKDGSNIFYDATGHMKSMTEVQQIMHDKLSQLTPQQQQFAIKTMFGQYALSGMTALINTSTGDYEKMRKQMDNNNSTTDAMNEKAKGLGVQMNMLSKHFDTFKKEIGDALAPTFRVVAGILNGLMSAFENLPAPMQKMIIGTAAVVAGLALFGGGTLIAVAKIRDFVMAAKEGVKVLGLVGGSIGKVIPAVTKMSGAFINGIRAVSASVIEFMATNPIGWILLIVAAVVALAIIIYKNWDSIKAFLSKTWSEITKVASTAWNAMVKFITDLWNGFATWIVNVGKQFVQGIVDAFLWMYNHNYYFKDLVDFIVKIWNILSTATTKVWNAIKSFIETGWNAIKQVTMTVWNAVVSWLTGVWNSISTEVSRVWNSFAAPVSKAWNNVSGAVNKGIGAVRSSITGLWNEAVNWGENLITMIANGIRNAAHKVASAAADVAHSISKFLGFHSPTEEGAASDSDQWAPNFVNMFAGGLKNGVGAVGDAANSLAMPMQNTFADNAKADAEKAVQTYHKQQSTLANAVKGIFSARERWDVDNKNNNYEGMRSDHGMAESMRSSIAASGLDASLFGNIDNSAIKSNYSSTMAQLSKAVNKTRYDMNNAQQTAAGSVLTGDSTTNNYGSLGAASGNTYNVTVNVNGMGKDSKQVGEEIANQFRTQISMAH